MLIGPLVLHHVQASQLQLLSHSRAAAPPATGPVSKIRLLGDTQHSCKIAFVEFATAESARGALKLSGALLGVCWGCTCSVLCSGSVL